MFDATMLLPDYDPAEPAMRLLGGAPAPIDPPESWPENFSFTRHALTSHIESSEIPCFTGPRCWHLETMLLHFFPPANPQGFDVNTIRPLADCLASPAAHTSPLSALGCTRMDHIYRGECMPSRIITRGIPGWHENCKLVALVVIARSLDITPKESDHLIGYCQRLMLQEIEHLTPRATVIFIAGGIAWDWRRDEIQGLLELGGVTVEYLQARLNEGRACRMDSVKFLQVLAGVHNRFVAE